MFLAKEKSALIPLPERDFEILSYSEHKVGINGFIYMGREKRYYSVPHIYINQEVKVISSRSIIKIYHKCQLIATHERPRSGKDKYVYKDEHLASHSREYRGRNKEQYIARGHYMMRALGEFIENMFITSNGPEETLYKSCDSLMHLAKETSPEIVEQACLKAIELQNYKFGFVTRLIKSQCKGLAENIDTTAEMAPPKQHNGIRGKSAFQ